MSHASVGHLEESSRGGEDFERPETSAMVALSGYGSCVLRRREAQSRSTQVASARAGLRRLHNIRPRSLSAAMRVLCHA